MHIYMSVEMHISTYIRSLSVLFLHLLRREKIKRNNQREDGFIENNNEERRRKEKK